MPREPIPPCGLHQPEISQAADGSWVIKTWAGGEVPIHMWRTVMRGHIRARHRYQDMPLPADVSGESDIVN